MLVDANVLLHSIDSASRHHAVSARWMENSLMGEQRIALPWASIGAFLRIATHPRVFAHPLTAEQAWSCVETWMKSPVTWVPTTREMTLTILGQLVRTHGVTANLIPDTQLAAQSIEHGIPLVTFDSDFERFPEITVVRPGEEDVRRR